jgi:Ni,Fe-hydrogenase maturation factor
VPQLLPELAEPLSCARRAYFVDAVLDSSLPPVSIIKLIEQAFTPASLHTSDPRQLLGIAHELYGRAPHAWLVRVQAEQLGFGESLSASARQAMIRALAWLRAEVTACAHSHGDEPPANLPSNA